MTPDLSSRQRIHIGAIGGAAMSAIAHILLADGHTVSGSDQTDSKLFVVLRELGCAVTVGHDAALVEGVDLVVISTAIKPGNVELDAAVTLGIPVATRPDMMEAIGKQRRTLAISGTHGKTTTSAMATLLAVEAGWDPSFIVGGQVLQLDTGVRWRPTEWLVVEADESDSSFLRFGAEAVIVMNVEPDHLDHHGTFAQLESAFDRFVAQAHGPRVICIDDAGAAALAKRAEQTDSGSVTTYGTHTEAGFRIENIVHAGGGSEFEIVHTKSIDANARYRLSVALPGDHVVRNAAAVFAMGCELGIEPDIAIRALCKFSGVGRRFEERGQARGVRFVDDYAHLPAEVATVVRAASRGNDHRVVAVFQPHRYTRIRDVGTDFATSFDGADVVIITGLYAAGQQPIDGISGRTVYNAIVAARPQQAIHYVETREELVALLTGLLQEGDLCLTMNAGDLTMLPDEMLRHPWAAGE
jgi:UDP-N-acetylmuramate--alanine ligase